MTREDALKAAEAYVAETVPVVAPTKANGYPVDGWRPTPPADRLDLVLKVARFLLAEEPTAETFIDRSEAFGR